MERKNTRTYDEELQTRLFEQNAGAGPSAPDDDELYYRSIKQALESPPEARLPVNFAQVVTARATRRKRIHVLAKSLTMYIVATLAMAVVGGVAFYFLAGDLFSALVKQLSAYKNPLFFGLAVFLLVQLFDEMLVKKKYWGRL